MSKPEPLKGKALIPPFRTEIEAWFIAKDIRSAVEWFNNKFLKELDGLDDVCLDLEKWLHEAFEDVMRDE